MTQGIQGTHVQIAGFARLFRTVLTEQNALLRVKIKRGAIVFFSLHCPGHCSGRENMQMDTIVTPGLVLKETRYKESDRILTILTPELGVISASAQSSLRLKNKLFSACGLFCYSEFVLLPGRNMYTIREAEVRNVFHGISSTIEGMSLAMYMAEMASALSPTGKSTNSE